MKPSRITRQFISLPELEDGKSRGRWRGGKAPCGRLAARVSRFRAMDTGSAMKTGAMSGLASSGSSASYRLQSLLESKLAERLAGSGCPLSRLIWSRADIPFRRSALVQRASGRTIAGKGSTGLRFVHWITPKAGDSLESWGMNLKYKSVLSQMVHMIPGRRKTSRLCSARITNSGQSLHINPEFSRWLMGFPPAWTGVWRTAS